MISDTAGVDKFLRGETHFKGDSYNNRVTVVWTPISPLEIIVLRIETNGVTGRPIFMRYHLLIILALVCPSAFAQYIPISAILGNTTTDLSKVDLAAGSRPALAHFLRALQNAKNHAVNIVILGDSQSIADSTVEPGAAAIIQVAASDKWADKMRAYFQGIYGSHGTGVTPAVINAAGSAINANFYRESATHGTNSTLGPHQIGSTGSVVVGPPGYVLTFTSPIPWDRLNTYCMTGPSGSGTDTWRIAIDGVPNGMCGGLNAGTTYQFAVATSRAVSLGTHTVTYTCVTGPCIFFAAEGTAGTTGVEISNLSVGGNTAEWWGTSPSTELSFLPLIHSGVQLAIEFELTNEPGVGYSTTSYQTALTNAYTYVRALPGTPSFMFISPGVDRISGQAPYYPILKSLAQSLGTEFVDFKDRWGMTYNAADGLYGTDTYHPNTKGNAEEYSMVMQHLIGAPIPAKSSSSSGASGATHLGNDRQR